jgi:hypothetical protein
MDQTLVASIRKNLESRSTEELRQAYEGGDNSAKSPEELEAMRQILDERRRKGNRAALALASAAVFGSLGAAYAWWQLGPGVEVLLYGVGGAVFGFAAWYIPDVIPWARV